MKNMQGTRLRKMTLFRNPRSSKLSMLLYSCIALGLIMGIVFPYYASFFVNWKPGMFIWFTMGCLVAGIIIGVANFYLMNIIIIKPLRKVRDAANAVAKKDLTVSLNIKSEDVIGDISNSVNSMLIMFESIVKELKKQTSVVTQSSVSVSRLTSNVLDNAVQQQKKSNESSALILQLLEGVTSINANALEAAENATRTEDSASQGGQELENAITSIVSLANELDTVSNTMIALESRSDSVDDVVKVISGIAEQTNLLALNAAIEAARAGEQGRGFAVVADEVRTLASRTRDSTLEIQSMIEDLQREIKAAVLNMQEAKNTAHNNSEAMTSVAEKLLHIIGAVGNIAETNRAIGVGSSEQKKLNESVNASIQSILGMSDIVVLNANESLGEIDQLIDLTEGLQNMMSGFKVSNK